MNCLINHYLDHPTRLNEWAVYGLVIVYVVVAIPYFATKRVSR